MDEADAGVRRTILVKPAGKGRSGSVLVMTVNGVVVGTGHHTVLEGDKWLTGCSLGREALCQPVGGATAATADPRPAGGGRERAPQAQRMMKRRKRNR